MSGQSESDVISTRAAANACVVFWASSFSEKEIECIKVKIM